MIENLNNYYELAELMKQCATGVECAEINCPYLMSKTNNWDCVKELMMDAANCMEEEQG